MKKIYTTIALTGLALTLAGVGVVSFAHYSQASKDALLKGDFTAYKTSIVESSKKKSDSLTQEQFNTMSTQAIAREATNKAIAEGNYENFKKSADARLLSKVTTQADFDKLVAQFKATKVIQDKINQAIKDNNFDAFKNAQTELKALRDANKPAELNSKHNHPIPTDAELKTRFDEIVAKFKADGTLPSQDMMDKGGKGGKGDRGEKGGRHGGR